MLALILTFCSAWSAEKNNLDELERKCAAKNAIACYDAAVIYWKTGRNEDRMAAKDRFMSACTLGHKAACQYAAVRDDKKSFVRSKSYVQVEKGAAGPDTVGKEAFDGQEQAIDLKKSRTNPRVCRKAKDKEGLSDGFAMHPIKRDDGKTVGKIDRLDAFNAYYDLGLRKGDIILEWNGKPFANAGQNLPSRLPASIKIDRADREYVIEANCGP